MSITNIRTALDTRLLSVLGGISSTWTAWDNKALKTAPTASIIYQIVSLLPARPDNPTLDEQTQIHAGIYQVLLMLPANASSLPGETLAQAISDHFYAGLALSYGGQTVRIRGTPIIAAGYQTGDRYAIPISVRYNSIV